MTLPLTGKRAFVTGGSRGIGAAIVRRLVADGATVAFTYVSAADRAAALEAELDGRALALHADSADADALRAAIAQGVERLGGLDILVNNAGVLVHDDIAAIPLQAFDRILDVNVRAVFVGAQAALAHLGQGGRIVNIGSIAGERAGFPGTSVYSMAKGAVAAFTRGLARDVAPRGITANNVQPGPTDTEITNAETQAILVPMMPIGRMGHGSEVAALVAWLCTPQAAFVNGASLTVDGGFTA